jgi:hypothetical protein
MLCRLSTIEHENRTEVRCFSTEFDLKVYCLNGDRAAELQARIRLTNMVKLLGYKLGARTEGSNGTALVHLIKE